MNEIQVMMDLARFDLNLLKMLDVLERERSVQFAAERLHLTPSAVSHALARLRRSLDDPLFARSGHELVPTQRCQVVLRHVRPFLSSVGLALDDCADPTSGFDPAIDRRTLTIVMPGALELSLLPALVRRLAQRAPGLVLSVKGFERRSYAVDLQSGEVDVVLSVGGHTPHSDGLSIDTLWQDELVALQGPKGPLPRTRPSSLGDIIGLPQVYPMPWPKEQNYLDIRLARQGRRRAIAISLPGYGALGAILSGTSLVATLPDRTALAIRSRHADLQVIKIAPEIRTALSLETSERFQTSAAGRWFLSELRSASEESSSLSDA